MKQAVDIDLVRKLQDEMRGFEDTMIYYGVAFYGLADAIAEEPRTVKKLASDLELSEEFLLDLFTYLTSIGIFTEDEDGIITNSSASELFREDDPSHIWHLAQFLPESVLKAWENIPTIMKTGSRQSNDRFGPDAEISSRSRMLFNGGMLSLAYGRSELAAIIEAFDFGQFSSVVDMGGGVGDFSQQLYQQEYPNQQVALFDQPKTEVNMITSSGIQRILGNFFKTIPEGFTLYFWKRVFHDFSDPEVIELLKLNRSVAPTAQVLICEMILTRDGIPSVEKKWSLLMRHVTAGKERTLDNWKEVIEAAGYRLVEVVETTSLMNLMLLEHTGPSLSG